MSAHNIQLFSGSVSIPDDLRVVSLTVEDGLVELGANGAFANVGYVMNNPGGSNAAVYYDKTVDQLRVVHTDFGGKEGPNTVTIKNEDITMNVSGNVHADFFRGDGGLLSNLVSDLQSVTAVEANSDQMIILSNATALWANVGNVLVEGNVTAGEFHGDGGWLTNVQTTFEETIINGNTTSNIVEFNNAVAFVTTGAAGIQNTAPVGDLSIGANVVFDDDATDILKVQGNINCEVITIGQWVLGGGGSQGLQQITDTGNTTTITTEFNNTSTAFKTVARAGIGTSTPSSDAMLHVDGHVRLGGPADTPNNEEIKVRAAGALNIIANHSNTDNTTSNLVMKAGEINAASITLAGAVTDDTRQRIVFKTRETEALTIDQFGNANFVSNVVVGTGAKFIGDGSGLTGLVSDLQSVSDGGATTNQTIRFTNATEGANISSNLYVGSNLHLDDVTLAAASVTLQGVTTNGATTTDAITITDTTQATTTSTGALKVSGGIAAAKDIRAANVVVNRVGVGLTAGANPAVAHAVEVVGNVKATNVIANNLTLNNVSLTTLYSLDQVVNVNNTTSNIVVISNTTPSTSLSTGCLQLSGGLGVNGNVYAQEFVNTNAGGWRLTHTHSTRPTVNGATVGGELTGGNGDVETGFLRLSGGGSTAGTGAPKSYIDICGASASTDFANNITFGIKGSEKVRLTDVGLGVGTTNPLSTLQVGDGDTTPTTGDASGSISVSGTGATKSNGGKPGLYHRALVGLGLWSDAHMSFEVNGFNGNQTEAMRISTGGNVGVGTSSPGQKLSIYTGSTSTSALSFDRYPTDNYRTDIYQNSYGPDFRVGYGAYTPESILYLKRLSDGSKEVEINGNVGIGTTNPMNKLDVRSGNYATFGKATTNSAGWSGIRLGTPYTTNHDAYCSVIESYNNHASDYNSTLRFKTSNGDNAAATERMRITSAGSVGIGTNDPHAQLHIGPKDYNHIYLASANNSYGWKLDTVDEGGGYVPFRIIRRTGGNDSTALSIRNQDGRVGIGVASALAPLDVGTSASGTVDVDDNMDGYYWSWNSSAGQTLNNSYTGATVAVNADGGSVVAHVFFAGYSIQFLSDRRIKKDIREIDDESALEKFRLLKPSKYKYIEPLLSGRTDKEVYGFIAQEVAEVLPEGVSTGSSGKDGTNQGHIPNIMSMCSIESQNISSDAYENLGTEQKGEYIETGNTYTRYVVTITKTIDPSTFKVNDDGSIASYKFTEQTKTTGEFDKNSDGKYHPLVFYSKDLKTRCTDVVRVIDDSSFVVDNKLFDLNDNLLLYGQKPDDFYRLNKDSIFTLASAALQEVDRQQQADKARIAELETQLASVLARLDALENPTEQ